MYCPRCNEQLEEGAVFCGNCGNQVVPIYARGATIAGTADKAKPGDKPHVVMRGKLPPQSSPQYFAPSPVLPEPRSTPPFTPMPPSASRLDNGRVFFFALILIILVVVISGSIIALIQNNGTHNTATGSVQGTVSFSDSQNGLSNKIAITVNGLHTPPSGFHYDAWLINEQNEQIMALGTLAEQGNTFTLNFTGKDTNLLAQGDKVEVTQEQGAIKLPIGKIILSAKFPALALIHIRHLLVSFPSTPGNIGLLVGLRKQAQLLNDQALILKNSPVAGNPVVVRCVVQSMINIIEGKQGAHTQALSNLCATLDITANGDGFGLLGQGGYLDSSSVHASLAATQPDATDIIKLHARHVIIATDNIKGWATTIDSDARSLLTNVHDATKINEMITLADHILNGVDLNHDGSIDPVPGEAGTTTAYEHGQLMATLTLTP